MPNCARSVLALAVFCSLASYTRSPADRRPGREAPRLYQPPSYAPVAVDRPLEPATRSASALAPHFQNLADALYEGPIKKGSEVHTTLHSLFVEWGAAEPEAAMAYLADAPQGIQRFSKAVLRGWAQSSDLDGASDWIEAHVAHPQSTPFYEALIDGLSDIGQPADALKLAIASSSDLQPALAERSVEHWARDDLPATSRWIEENEVSLAPPVRDRVLSGYARAWAQQAPQEAASWAQSLPPSPARNHALHAAVDQWVQKDATAAGYWIFSQKKDEAIEQTLSETAAHVSHVNPEAAFAFIENDPANEADPQRLRGHQIMALDTVMRKAPEQADPWIKRVEAQTLAAAAEGLTHAPYRVSPTSYAEMFNRWAAQDEEAALAYLENATQIDATDRAAIQREALKQLQADDPEKAAYYLFKLWKDADQANAVAFAASSPETQLDLSVSNLESQYLSVAEAWAATDPEAVGFYLERQEVLEPEETAALLLAMEPIEN